MAALALWAWTAPAPGDRPLPAPLPDGPLRLTVFGTSLSAPSQTWPEALAARIEACRGAPVELGRVAGIDRGSAWALGQVDRVAAQDPDLVLVEFAINDADLLDGVLPPRARAQHAALLAALRAALPEARLVLLTMSPARGPRGWLRPFLARHYAQYGPLAAAAGTGLVDLHARWRAAPGTAAALAADGLHPDPDAAAAIAAPALAAWLGCARP